MFCSLISLLNPAPKQLGRADEVPLTVAPELSLRKATPSVIEKPIIGEIP